MEIVNSSNNITEFMELIIISLTIIVLFLLFIIFIVYKPPKRKELYYEKERTFEESYQKETKEDC